MNKKIISKKLEGNNVITVYEETAPRYSLCEREVDFDMELENIQNFCTFFLEGKFSHINNTELKKTEDFETNAKAFLDYCKEKNLSPRIVSVYDHSDYSFSFSDFPTELENYNTRHGWDSYCCGFVGIEKDNNLSDTELSGWLSDIMNGYICGYEIYDSLEDDFVDFFQTYSHDYKGTLKAEKDLKEKYNIEASL